RPRLRRGRGRSMRARCLGAIQAVPWTGFWLGAGLVLRLVHYLSNPSLWHDEAAVVVNVLRKGYVELLGPLLLSEAAPPLFVWLEKAVVGLCGDSLYSFRLVPFLASCTALAGVVACARRVLPAEAVPWVALFAACSDTVLWHTCEAKPYAVDLLIVTGLLAQLVFGRAWPLERHLILASVLAPVVIFLSYPGCFLLGGLALCLLPAVVRARRAGTWLLFGLFLTSLGVAFLFLWL